MKKILCEYCEEIIEVEEGVDTVYCPKCFKSVSLKQGEKKLPIYKEKRFQLALTQLNIATEYKKAEEGFVKILQIEANNVDSMKGVILASLYQSTVRESHFLESIQYFKTYKDELSKNVDDFELFINEINDELNFYLDEFKNRLFDYDHFFEEKGKDIFFKHSEDIISYKKVLINASSLKEVKSLIQKEINELRELLKRDWFVESSPFHRLDSSSKESHIKDGIFKDVRKSYRQRKSFLILFLIFFALMVAGISLLFILPSYLLIGVPIASLGFVFTLVFGITYLVIEKKLK